MADPNESTPETEAEAQAESNDDQMIDDAMAQAQASLNDLKAAADDDDPEAVGSPVDLPDLTGEGDSGVDATGIELLGDVDLHVTVELGRTEMLVEDVLKLGEGSVVELDKLAGDPVDVYVNNRLVARGEVLVLNDNFCIRISEIVADLEEQAEAAVEQQAAD